MSTAALPLIADIDNYSFRRSKCAFKTTVLQVSVSIIVMGSIKKTNSRYKRHIV